MYFSAFFEIYSRPYRAKKKCKHFSSPEKKYIWWRATIRGALAGRRSTLGQRWVNLGSTLGQPWVNVGSTLGNLRTYLGPIFADFARVSGETEGLHGVLIRNDQFSNRETAFSGFVLDQSPLRAPWEKKKRIPNVSTVAPIGAKKKCKHFSSPRKKGTFGGFHG